MGDIVGDFAQARHQFADAAEHLVEAGASRSSSSPEPETGRRRVRSPAMIARAELFIASMRRSTRRATNSAPSAAERGEEDQRHRQRADHHRADARAIAEVVADQQAEAAGQHEDARQRAAVRSPPPSVS